MIIVLETNNLDIVREINQDSENIVLETNTLEILYVKPIGTQKSRDIIYAVITGDIIGSQKWKIDERENLLNNLKVSLNKIENYFTLPYSVFRGDSFQMIISHPEDALKASILLRSDLLSRRLKNKWLDVRISIGIGTIDYFPKNEVGEGDGEAFRYSGLELDKIKKKKMNIIITTPWNDMNDELKTECALLDAIILRWTREQAEAMFLFVNGLKQEEIAEKLGIIQPSVNQRLKLGGYLAIQEFLQRYRTIMKQKITPESPERTIQ